MRSKTTRAFRQLLNDLPPEIQRQVWKAYQLFRVNPYHPSLRFKRIVGNVYAVRITRNYRALGVVRDDAITWFWIGSHDEYQRLIEGI